MDRKFWASRRLKMVGPFSTRHEAIEHFRSAYPIKGPDYVRAAKRNQFHTGYGEFGPHFSIEWHDA